MSTPPVSCCWSCSWASSQWDTTASARWSESGLLVSSSDTYGGSTAAFSRSTLALDAIAYKAALLARLDEQIHLLRSVTYWYLLPLSLPSLWQAVHVWDKSPWAAAVSLAVVVVLFVFLRWLNLTAGVGASRATRANVESMFPMK